MPWFIQTLKLQKTAENGAIMINSPFKWVGGKSRLRKYIVPLIPEHECYVEPFGGAAWVLFGKSPSPIEILNDIDEELINFFRVVRDRPEELMASFDLELVSRAEFRRLAEADPRSLSEIKRAHRFYYLIMAGWGGEARYPRFQSSKSDGGHGNRLIGALKTLRKRIEPVHDRLKTVIIENQEWSECIDRYDGVASFLYLDPPYPGNGANYKHNMRLPLEHVAISERLRSVQGKWILSSYDTEEIRERFNDYNIIPVQAASGMKAAKMETDGYGRKRTLNREVLILNYHPQGDCEVRSEGPRNRAFDQPNMFERNLDYTV